ncbi:MAG: RecX family transcriptional regulator [Solirubrobacterales bacterium]|nr:RecX family transcriptional regulator [Solirubrobacterales bacterium]MCB8970104.1 RecX family transcriptional regulator [Thermoleophilales bacterium]MCO5326800.1 RecX family transcriptional regulator [Solirubrobacterales bacterium]
MERPSEGEERSREAAMVAAVGALRRRERTVAEMHEWLTGRDVRSDVIDAVISDLTEVGELDDDRFGREFARDKRELSGWGPERIEAALVDRGLERSLAESVAVEGHDEQLERATAQVRGRFGELRDDGDRNRALQFLARRGYGYELAYDAVRRAGRDAA